MLIMSFKFIEGCKLILKLVNENIHIKLHVRDFESSVKGGARKFLV